VSKSLKRKFIFQGLSKFFLKEKKKRATRFYLKKKFPFKDLVVYYFNKELNKTKKYILRYR